MKYLILLFPLCSFAWTPPDSFNSSYIEIEESILSATIKGHYKQARSELDEKLINTILQDENNLVDNQFDIPKYFEPSVRFWFSIYTQYTSDQVVIHDMENLDIVYNVVDFEELQSDLSIHRFAKEKLKSHLTKEYIKRLKKNLISIGKKKLSKLSKEEDIVYQSILKSKINIPKKRSARKKFFKKLASAIRAQSGQRNRIFEGVIRSYPYLPFLEKQLVNFNLPNELIAISFLESSFNVKAKSKVAASGIWQFMPFIGNIFMPKLNDHVDYRQSPIISSLAAFHLLKQNFKILKRWDLAVPAYNSGTKHLIRAQRKFSKKMKKSKISLEYILENYDHAHIGFASQNFYSEFLALTRVLAYKDKIYPLTGAKIKTQFTNPDKISVYVNLCKLKPKSFFKKMIKSSPFIKELNYQFNSHNHLFPKGNLVSSDLPLSEAKFLRLTDKQLKSLYPKNYYKYARKKKCK